MQLLGLGPADYVYAYGPTFDPTGTKGCFYVDGEFAITQQSDGSNHLGTFDRRVLQTGGSHAQADTPTYGNPQWENDTIEFANETGQFAGLRGTAEFSEQVAGAWFVGTLTGTLAP